MQVEPGFQSRSEDDWHDARDADAAQTNKPSLLRSRPDFRRLPTASNMQRRVLPGQVLNCTLQYIPRSLHPPVDLR